MQQGSDEITPGSGLYPMPISTAEVEQDPVGKLELLLFPVILSRYQMHYDFRWSRYLGLPPGPAYVF